MAKININGITREMTEEEIAKYGINQTVIPTPTQEERIAELEEMLNALLGVSN